MGQRGDVGDTEMKTWQKKAGRTGIWAEEAGEGDAPETSAGGVGRGRAALPTAVSF